MTARRFVCKLSFSTETARINQLITHDDKLTMSLCSKQCLNNLGIIMDPDLCFSQHCKEKINTAYAILGMVYGHFESKTLRTQDISALVPKCHFGTNAKIWDTSAPVLKSRAEDTSAPLILHTQKCLPNGISACVSWFFMRNRPM